jgi:hypothetical protein
MKKAILVTLFLTLFVLTAGYTQNKQTKPVTKASAESTTKIETAEITPEGNVYREITVLDFENIEFKDSDIIFQKAREEEYKVAIRDETPAPISSKKYLGVKLKGTRANSIQIKFPNDKMPTIDKYCQSISMWVYGKNFTGELSLFLMDAEGKTYKLVFGKLNFQGWHKLTQAVPSEVWQTDKYLEKKSNIKLLSITYVPGTFYAPGAKTREAIWQSFYIDDITAKVREKYADKQSDEW